MCQMITETKNEIKYVLVISKFVNQNDFLKWKIVFNYMIWISTQKIVKIVRYRQEGQDLSGERPKF